MFKKSNINNIFTSYTYGIVAEFIAICYLTFKGYRIFKWRYKTFSGEIDIIAKKFDTLAIIEVKARKEKQNEVLTEKQKRRINKAAAILIAKYPKFANLNIRYDLVIIHNLFFIQHIRNAWESYG